MADNPWEVSLPVPRREMGDWPKRALCKELCDKGAVDPELGTITTDWWFPVKPAGVPGPWANHVNQRTAAAKAICAQCPVKEPCLEWALENGEHGIWGGMGPKARAPLPKPRTCAECGARFVKPRTKATTATCSVECQKAREYRRKRTPELAARQREAQAAYRERQATG